MAIRRVRRGRKVFRKKTAAKFRPSKSLVKTIQRVIHKDVETKTASVQVDNTPFNSAISVSGDSYKLLGSISQGTDNASRIGAKIKAMSLDIRGHLNLNVIPISNSAINQAVGAINPNCRVAVRLLILQPKQFGNVNQAQTNYDSWMPYLLENGATNSPFNGNTKDLYLPINRDAVTVYMDKVFYVNIPMQYALATSANTVIPMAGSVRFFRKRINLKKLLRYTDQGDVPTNWAPMLACGYGHIGGETPDILTTTCNVSFVSTLRYEDA